MTQADSASALRRSLTSPPGEGQAATMRDPLPEGWRAFCSRPDRARGVIGRWYATAPYMAHRVPGQNPRAQVALVQTVEAATWPALHVAVAEQVALYRELTGGQE